MNEVRRLHLELGYFCNIRCVMCYQKNYTEKLPEYIWREKLLPIYSGLRELNIQGGELTMMPEAKELITLVKKYNNKVKFGCMTNGLRFDDYWQDEFIDNGFMLNFSLNAASLKTYEKMCKYSNYDKVLSNLKELLRKRNEKKVT
jgi:MoaA/NifB/PqqE/SkfB family radical SAM enzyme